MQQMEHLTRKYKGRWGEEKNEGAGVTVRVKEEKGAGTLREKEIDADFLTSFLSLFDFLSRPHVKNGSFHTLAHKW